MKNTKTNIVNRFLLSSFVLLLFAASAFAQIVRQSAGANPAAISAEVELFRQDLGADNGVGNSYTTGRREITWDDAAGPYTGTDGGDSGNINFLPYDFYNKQIPRGAVITTPCSIEGINVSARPNNNLGVTPRFGHLNPTYPNTFQTFSGEQLAVAISYMEECSYVDIDFYVPGTRIPASVKGFGAVYSDLETVASAGFILYDEFGNRIYNTAAPVHQNGLSFLGVSYTNGKRISRVRISVGDERVARGTPNDSANYDVVVLDNLIFGEPRAIGHHASDFDGDGSNDYAVFRPSDGNWYILRSGSNSYSIVNFGIAGDVPSDGDFDGDSLNDFTVFRPSTGTWYSLRSSDGQVRIAQFGLGDDKPVAGDYDRDGKTDFAVWRPSDGNYYSLNSSSGQAKIIHWGANGDIPIGSTTNMP